MATVLFVSKPIAPPFHDGTKCLVRGLACHLERHRAQVLSTRDGVRSGAASALGFPGHVEFLPVYRGAGSFAPSALENARALGWLVTRARADVWHFVFAPNPRSSPAARAARWLAGVPVLQTVASPPRRFDPDLFFGDVVVAQSRWTRERIVEAYRESGRTPPRLEVIPPPMESVAPRDPEAVQAVRRTLRLEGGAPVFVYPGDLEVSNGAETVADAIEPILAEEHRAIVVFACRQKTTAAPAIAARLEARLDPRSVRFAGETDLIALLGAVTAVLFPVDDLWGKVDLPIAVLEAMQLGVPVVALDSGPLLDLEGVVRVPARDPRALARAAVALARDAGLRDRTCRAAREHVASRHAAGRVAREYEQLYEDVLTRAPR